MGPRKECGRTNERPTLGRKNGQLKSLRRKRVDLVREGGAHVVEARSGGGNVGKKRIEYTGILISSAAMERKEGEGHLPSKIFFEGYKA